MPLPEPVPSGAPTEDNETELPDRKRPRLQLISSEPANLSMNTPDGVDDLKPCEEVTAPSTPSSITAPRHSVPSQALLQKVLIVQPLLLQLGTNLIAILDSSLFTAKTGRVFPVYHYKTCIMV